MKSHSLFQFVNKFCHKRLNAVLKDKDGRVFGRGWEHYPFCHKKYVKNSERCEYFLTSIQKILILQPVEDNLFSLMSSFIKLSAYKTIFVVSAHLTFSMYSFFCLNCILYLQRVHAHTCFITWSWWLWGILIIEWEIFILGSLILICYFLLLPLFLDGIKLLAVDPCWKK